MILCDIMANQVRMFDLAHGDQGRLNLTRSQRFSKIRLKVTRLQDVNSSSFRP